MIERVEIRREVYHDSVSLMMFSRDARALEGVVDAAVMLATPTNLELLARQGYSLPEERVQPDDLVVAVRATDDAAADEVARSFVEWSARRRESASVAADAPTPLRSVGTRKRDDPDANLLLVSVPGPHAAYEVAAGLEAGMNVFCFASGLSIEDERALKTVAAGQGLLLMGPDCGTAIIDGIGIGFANALERGPVGIVGASGTGIQEVSSLLDAAGVGVSHAIGVGSRDLSDEVGGIMTWAAMDALAHDPGTETIVLLSKLVGGSASQELLARLHDLPKPSVVCFLGVPTLPPGSVRVVGSLFEAASVAAGDYGRTLSPGSAVDPSHTPGDLRGLFCGGTLCGEAAAVAVRSLGTVSSNVRVDGARPLDDLWESRGHTLVDLGDEALTEGRVHPMIDPTLRNERAIREGLDPAVGVVLMDVILGYGSHPDPASELAPIVAEIADARDGSITVVISICGTDGDPQDLGEQQRRLEAAGAIVTRSVTHAARIAVAAVTEPRGAVG